jgi:hypothetical protein
MMLAIGYRDANGPSTASRTARRDRPFGQSRGTTTSIQTAPAI